MNGQKSNDQNGNTAVKDPKSPIFGIKREQLARIRDYYKKRSGMRLSPQQLLEGSRRLKTTPATKNKKTRSVWKKLLKLCWSAIGREDEELFLYDEQEWGEGSGLGETATEKLIDRLYVMPLSIKAGNTLSKLRKAVVSLLSVLVEQGIINDFQRRKITRLPSSKAAKKRGPSKVPRLQNLLQPTDCFGLE